MDDHPLCKASTTEEIQELLRRGADINYVHPLYKITALMSFCISGKFENVKILVDNGADINIKDGSDTAIILATRNGHLEIMKFLLEKIEKENFDSEAESCLGIACRYGHCDIFDYLIPLVSDINKSYLKIAVAHGNIDIVDRLLALGVDVNDSLDEGSDTPLIYACFGPHNTALAIIDRLICFGADFNFQGYNGNTALIYSASDRYEIVERLISVGCDLNLRSKYGDTALIRAVKFYDEAIVKILLDAGADKEIMNNEGKRAIDYAETEGIKNLLE